MNEAEIVEKVCRLLEQGKTKLDAAMEVGVDDGWIARLAKRDEAVKAKVEASYQAGAPMRKRPPRIKQEPKKRRKRSVGWLGISEINRACDAWKRRNP